MVMLVVRLYVHNQVLGSSVLGDIEQYSNVSACWINLFIKTKKVDSKRAIKLSLRAKWKIDLHVK